MVGVVRAVRAVGSMDITGDLLKKLNYDLGVQSTVGTVGANTSKVWGSLRLTGDLHKKLNQVSG